jgi:methionine aminotransferase
LISKLPGIKSSIFSVMTRMAQDYNAINLSQGFPDFDGPEELLSLVSYYITSGKNQYAPMPGIPELRNRISEKTEMLYSRKYDPENEIVITSGATEAIYTAISCSVNRNDEVIIFEPAYDSYAPSVLINGGIPVFIPLTQPGYNIDWERVKDKITAKTRMIIINSPHNPTGRVINRADLQNLAEITRNSNILILSDEVYEHIVFDSKKHVSLAESAELSERTFVISSFGKTYHSTGWKVGYCSAPAALMTEFKKVHQFIVFSVNTPVQYAYADFLSNKEHYLNLKSFYQDKRDLLIQNLKSSGFSLIPSEGTYFQLLDYSPVSDLQDTEFAEYLTKNAGVAVIPLSPFYSSVNTAKTIRVCFAKRNEVITEACKRLCSVNPK